MNDNTASYARKWFDDKGMPVDVTRIFDVNLILGTAKVDFKPVCTRCKGRGALRHTSEKRCRLCSGTGSFHVVSRTVYTLDALFRVKPDIARQVKSMQKPVSRFGSWSTAHQTVIDQIAEFAPRNKFLQSLAQQLQQNRVLTDKQITVAKSVISQF